MDYPRSDDEDSDRQLRQRFSSEDYSSSESDSYDNSILYDNDDERPQQLVKITRTSNLKESFQLKVDHAVLERVLKSCEGRPISVINTIGDCKSGKSLMMNHIVQKLKSPGVAKAQWLTRIKHAEGFPYKPGYDPVTEGIWVWNEALIIQSDDDDEEIAVIVMDTQGFSEEYTTEEEILLLTGISVVSSSLLIVNLMGEFPEAALEWLSPICRCGHLCIKNGVKTPFQQISYLVRDWSMLQQYGPWGDKGGSKLLSKMLEKFKPSGGKLSPVFEDIDCTLLPHIGEKALQKHVCGNSTALCPEFLTRYAKYINEQLHLDKLAVKRVLGNNLDPDSFKAFFLAYVQMFNEALTGDGLSPDVYWETTMKVAEEIKTERGLAEYQKNTSGDLVLRTSDINSLHEFALKKCLKAFRKFRVPKSEESIMETNIRDFLAKKMEQLTTCSRNTWEREVEQKLEEGQRLTRAQTEERYPCLFSDNPGLIFYDDTELAKFYEDAMVSWVEDAVEDMECENEEDVESLKAEYKNVLQKRGRQYKKTNADIKKAAEEKMVAVVSKLTQEYSLAINDMMEVEPNIDTATLQKFHCKEIKTMERKFREVAVGTPDYREQWADKLREDVEKEMNKRKAGMESTMTLALGMVSEAEKKYKTELEAAVVMKNMKDEEIKKYHDQHVESILEGFKTINPFPEEAPNSSRITEKLRTSLNTVFTNVLQERMERLEEFYSQAVTTVFDEMRIQMEAELVAVGFWDLPQFEEWSLHLKQGSLERMNEIIANRDEGGQEEAVLLQKREELTAKMEVYLDQQKAKNRRCLAEVEGVATKTLAECVSNWEVKMTNAVRNLDTRNELLEEQERVTLDTVEDFRIKSGIRNIAFLDMYSQQIRTKTEKLFEGMDELFTMKKNEENTVLVGVIADVKKIYMEEMKQLTKSGRGCLSTLKLQEANDEAKHLAMKAVTADTNLTSFQHQVVMDHLGKCFETFQEKNALAVKTFNETDVAIGIDLGTTFCCVAVYLHGKVQVLRNDLGTNTTPSYVCITSNGDYVFGQNAKKMAHKFPESTIFDAKRILGRTWDDEDLEKDRKYWPFTVKKVDGVPQIEVHDKYYRPEEISSLLLKHLKEGAEKVLNVKISKAVITVPAYFTDGQRQATVKAGKLAGLEVLGILNEPSAAALEYRFDWFHDTEPRKVLVYDLGGGTFDVAVLKMGEKSIDVLSVHGDSHLGGEDFDQTVMQYCADMFKNETGIDVLEDKDSDKEILKKPVRRRLRRLQTQCEEGKKQVMTSPSANISVDAFVGEQDLDVDMSREEFEEMNLELFQRTIDIVDIALNEANIKKEEIDDVILVGGSTRIPKIQSMLQEYLGGKSLNARINPDEAVACGAALQAVMLNCQDDKKPPLDFGVIKEVTPMSLGVELSNNRFDVIIPKNTKFPVECKEVYGTLHDKQTTAEIKVFQGEHSTALDNKLLATLAPGSQESVEVLMTIDHNGILKVEATCLSTGMFCGFKVQEKKA